MNDQSPIFNTDRRIRLGIWGLGRGMSFYRTCAMLNFDVVAGCDYNAHMRERFLHDVPGAMAFENADEFLAHDFDAVLLATFCPAHAGDAIKCLDAGKHVLSEVTAFHTLAEGVALVEAVERSGLVYNLAENYPFIAALDWLRRKWQEGLFGELMYAEFEYVHECRSLCYTYIDGVPVQPGNTVHNWRSWQHFHYYCTHSLGPIMIITGERPTRVVSLPAAQMLAGYLDARGMGMGGIAPSLINMSNGAVVRNLMGATTNDTHIQRIWGTRGSAEVNVGKSLQLRLGGGGGSPKMEVTPSWDALGEQAAQTGHGGGDFWVLYYFARQILTGVTAPFDIYAASDVTIPGILALRSAVEDGTPYDVPDFRDPAQRNRHRDDDWAQPPYDVTAVFPKDADTAVTGQFTTVMSQLIDHALAYRAYADWATVTDNLTQPETVLELLDKLIGRVPALLETYDAARRIVDAYPESDGATVLRQMLELGDEARVTASGFAAALHSEQAALQMRYPHAPVAVTDYAVTALLPRRGAIDVVVLPDNLTVAPLAYNAAYAYADVRAAHGGIDGLLFIRATVTLPAGGTGQLRYGADGPVKVWVNGIEVGCVPDATNPTRAGEYRTPATWLAGENTIIFALHTHNGQAWGVTAQAVVTGG